MSRIVHICVPEKFIPPFIQFVGKHFKISEHLFLLGGRKSKHANYPLPRERVIPYFGYINKINNLRRLYSAEKIVLHGLYESQFLYLLVLQPWLLKKCFWVIWGGDLHQFQEPRTKLKSQLKEWVRARVIRRLEHIVTYIPEDFELAQKWYSTSATFHECLCYESNTVATRKSSAKKSERLTIQVGNSAYPRNNHYDAIDRIAQFATADIQVIAPLSYGPKDEAQRVAAYGKARLGDKFTAVIDFLPLEKYLEQLDRVDIGLFNQNHQQAMGNMISLLGMGKTLYLRRNTSPWNLFTKLGVKIFAVEEFSLQMLSEVDKQRNIDLVTEYFSTQCLVAQYEAIFNS
ncbi:MAG: TDP-N-acetylfucosamine:lipid II N-acetylfucosaminyltransferase [Verrucomicrobiota bacterium]